jgi:predicted nucleic acid-binding protein
MQLATTDSFRACWTDAIHEEWIRSVLANRPDLSRDQLERTKELMNTNVLDSLVSDYEHLIPVIELPDENDRHVVAAAMRCGASAIVTYNEKDFPAAELAKYDIETIAPDDFLVQQFHLSEATVIDSARKVRARLRNPPHSAEQYLMTLEKQRLPKTVTQLRGFRDLI